MQPPNFSDDQLQKMMELRDQHRIATATQHAELASLSHKLSLLLTADSIDRKEIGSIQTKISALHSELAGTNAKLAIDGAEILTAEQRQKMRHRLLLLQGRPGFGPGHGPGPFPGDVLFSMPPMAGACATPFGGGGFFTEAFPAPFTIPLGPPPMFGFSVMRGGLGHMFPPPPGGPPPGLVGPGGGSGPTPGSPPGPPPEPPPGPPPDSLPTPPLQPSSAGDE